MKIGYARVSTTDQNLELQLAALKQAGCGRIYQEKISGAKRERPELQRLLDQLRPDDIVVVWKLDRLARSTQNLLELVELIKKAEASFCSISEPWADTTSHSGKMIMTVFAGIAEFERDLIRERTSAGRKQALIRGVRFGRPKKMNNDQKILVLRLLNEGKSIKEIAKTFNVHNATVYRLLDEGRDTSMRESSIYSHVQSGNPVP
jgi:DNA invertase Pin-like site-specific DNA recombinase